MKIEVRDNPDKRVQIGDVRFGFCIYYKWPTEYQPSYYLVLNSSDEDRGVRVARLRDGMVYTVDNDVPVTVIKDAKVTIG